MDLAARWKTTVEDVAAGSAGEEEVVVVEVHLELVVVHFVVVPLLEALLRRCPSLSRVT